MANDEIHPVSIYGSARSVAAMRTPDHMLTKVESNRIVATDCSSGPVLVVDDDPAVRHLISDYFGQHGITTVSATGRSAVARELARGDTSAIILDLHLGQDDGFDLLREIRSSSDLPVIILTGRSRDEVDCVVGLELGADDYLTKPFGIRELYARFRAVLRRRVSGSSLRTRDVERGGPGSTKTSSIAASMFRCCGCGANWRQTRRCRVSSRPNAASAMSLQFLSNKAVCTASRKIAHGQGKPLHACVRTLRFELLRHNLGSGRPADPYTSCKFASSSVATAESLNLSNGWLSQ